MSWSFMWSQRDSKIPLSSGSIASQSQIPFRQAVEQRSKKASWSAWNAVLEKQLSLVPLSTMASPALRYLSASTPMLTPPTATSSISML